MPRLEKSAHLRAQEARLAELEQEIGRLRVTIKSLRTRLLNTQERIITLQRDLFNTAQKLEDRFRAALARARTLFDKLTNDSRLSPLEREELQWIASAIPAEEDLPEEEIPVWEEWEEREGRARREDFFTQFQAEPPAPAQRDIRALYIELSKMFHPDRASSRGGEEERLKELQQQVVEAYQRNDVQALLQLRDRFADPALAIEEQGTDLLQGKIDRLVHERELLNGQRERLSAEIKSLRQSEAGRMLTQADSMDRAGFSFGDVIGIGHNEDTVRHMEQMVEALEDTDRKGRLSKLFDQLARELTAQVDPELVDVFMEELDKFMRAEDYDDGFAEEGLSAEDIRSAFAGESWFADDWDNFHPRPKFPDDTPVTIGEGCFMEYHDALGNEQSLDLEGLSGRVFIPMLDLQTEKAVYHVRLDGRSLRHLPIEYVEDRVLGREPVDLLFYLPEKHLRRKKVKRHESVNQQRRICRELTYAYALRDVDDAKAALLREILLAEPGESDAVNWLGWLEEHLPLPLDALTRWSGPNWQPNQPAEIRQGLRFDDELGLLVFARIKDEFKVLPLSHFWIEADTPAARMLEAYGDWDQLRPVPAI